MFFYYYYCGLIFLSYIIFPFFGVLLHILWWDDLACGPCERVLGESWILDFTNLSHPTLSIWRRYSRIHGLIDKYIRPIHEYNYWWRSCTQVGLMGAAAPIGQVTWWGEDALQQQLMLECISSPCSYLPWALSVNPRLFMFVSVEGCSLPNTVSHSANVFRCISSAGWLTINFLSIRFDR
jgi:hypothetical protein